MTKHFSNITNLIKIEYTKIIIHHFLNIYNALWNANIDSNYICQSKKVVDNYKKNKNLKSFTTKWANVTEDEFSNF